MTPFKIGCLVVVLTPIGLLMLSSLTSSVSKSLYPPPTPIPSATPTDEEREQEVATQATATAAQVRNAAAMAEQDRRLEKQFLASRAGKIWQKHPTWSRDVCDTIAKHKISIGMTAEQVREAWGRPYKINQTLTGQSVREQWVMHDSLESDYLYFVDGVLRSIQRSK